MKISESEFKNKVRNNQEIEGKPALQWFLDNIIAAGRDDSIGLEQKFETEQEKNAYLLDLFINETELLIKNDQKVGRLPALEYAEQIKEALGFRKIDTASYFIVYGLMNDAKISGQAVADWAIKNGRMNVSEVVEFALEHNCKVNGKPALQWAVENNYLVNGKPALEYAATHGIKIDGVPAVEWAIQQDLKVDRKPVIQWAVEKGYVEKDDIIAIAVSKNYVIEDKPVLEWALDHPTFLLKPKKDKLLQSAIDNDYMVGNTPALEWAYNNNRVDITAVEEVVRKDGKVGGKAALEWCIDKGVISEEKAMAIAVKNDLKIDGMTAIEWVVKRKDANIAEVIKYAHEKGATIDGIPPLEWARTNEIPLGPHTQKIHSRGEEISRPVSPIK